MDWTDTNLPADQVERINASKLAHVEQNTVMRTFLIRMNNLRPPFDNLNARRAFAHAFNSWGSLPTSCGYAKRDPTPMPNTLWGCPTDAAGYDYD